MNMEVSFSIKVNMESISKISNEVDASTERPARFVPIINVESNGEIYSTQNAKISIPNAKALFNNKVCDVTVKVYNPYNELIEISNNKVILSEIGTYRIEYMASTEEYKTNLGNDSFSKIIINVISSATGSDIVYVNDVNNILPEKYFVQAQSINEGEIYDKISKALLNVSENYEVTNISIINENGEKIKLDNDIEFYIKTNPDYNRNDVVVYHVDDDKLTKVDSKGYGRYILLNTSLTGDFVVCVPGVAFHMPIWGYILIALGSLIILLAIIILVIVLIKKGKKKRI